MSEADTIRRQLARWMHLDDRYQDDEWMTDILHDDFSFHVGSESYVGKGAIREFNRVRDQGPPRGKHILSEPVIEFINESSALVTTDYIYVCAAPGSRFEITSVGQYCDRMCRDEDGAWRVLTRRNTRFPEAAPTAQTARKAE